MSGTACALYTDGRVEFFELADNDPERYRQCREVIGNYIEALRLPYAYMLVDEEGKLRNLDANPVATQIYGSDIIVGNVVMIGDDGSPEFVGLIDEWIETLKDFVAQ